MASCMKDAEYLGQYSVFENKFWNFFAGRFWVVATGRAARM